MSPDGVYYGEITARSAAGPTPGITYDFVGRSATDPGQTIRVQGIEPANRPWPANCPIFGLDVGTHGILTVSSSSSEKYQLMLPTETPHWIDCNAGQ